MGSCVWLAAFTLSAATTACSNTPDLPPALGNMGGHDSGTAGDGGTLRLDSGSGAPCHSVDGGCNDLMLCGSLIYRTSVPTAGPTPTGGMVPDGTYRETVSSVFTGAGGVSGTSNVWERETLTISTSEADGGTVGDAAASEAGADDAGGALTTRFVQDMTENNTHPPSTSSQDVEFDPAGGLSIGFTCPSPNAATAAFTYHPATQTLSIFQVTGTLVVTGERDYVKQ